MVKGREWIVSERISIVLLNLPLSWGFPCLSKNGAANFNAFHERFQNTCYIRL